MNVLQSAGQAIDASIQQTVADYGVNPLIFVAIYMVSYLPYLWGVYILGKGIRRHNNRLVVQGAVLNRIGWAAPFLYVILYGHNLPAWFFVSLIAWTIIGISLVFSETQRRRLYRSANWAIDVALKLKEQMLSGRS